MDPWSDIVGQVETGLETSKGKGRVRWHIKNRRGSGHNHTTWWVAMHFQRTSMASTARSRQRLCLVGTHELRPQCCCPPTQPPSRNSRTPFCGDFYIFTCKNIHLHLIEFYILDESESIWLNSFFFDTVNFVAILRIFSEVVGWQEVTQ